MASERPGDKYEFLEFVGSGCSGAVWNARSRDQPPQNFCIKVVFNMQTGCETKMISTRYETDFRLLEDHDRLPRHSNIIKVFEHFLDDPLRLKMVKWEEVNPILKMKMTPSDIGVPTLKNLFVVMEKMQTDLKKLSAQRVEERQDQGPPYFSPFEASTMILQISDALHHLKEHMIVHRDLKADNILLNTEGIDHWQVKLCDFGECWDAKRFGGQSGRDPFACPNSGQSPGGAVMALAPEVHRAVKEQTDFFYGANDMWALGACMYAILAERDDAQRARSPFPKGGYIQSQFRKLDAKECPEAAVRDLIEKMLWVEPKERLRPKSQDLERVQQVFEDRRQLSDAVETKSAAALEKSIEASDQLAMAENDQVRNQAKDLLKKLEEVEQLENDARAQISQLEAENAQLKEEKQRADEEAANARRLQQVAEEKAELADVARKTAEAKIAQLTEEIERSKEEKQRADEEAANARRLQQVAEEKAELADVARKTAEAKSAQLTEEIERSKEEKQRADEEAANARRLQQAAEEKAELAEVARMTAEAGSVLLKVESEESNEEKQRANAKLPQQQECAKLREEDGKLQAGTDDHTAKIGNRVTVECRQTFKEHTDAVWSAVFSPDASSVLTASKDCTAKIWNAATGECRQTLTGHRMYVSSAVFSRDGTSVLTASYDETAKIWDVSTGECRQTFVGHTKFVLSAAFSPDDSSVLTASSDSTAKISHADTGECRQTFIGHSSDVNSAVFSWDGTSVLTASSDGTAKIWNVDTGECRQTFVAHRGVVMSAVFSWAGTSVLTASSDYTAKIWNVSTGECMQAFTDSDGFTVNSAVFSPDGLSVLTASAAGTANVWKVGNGECMQTFTGHKGQVKSAVFSEDGASVLTASLDRIAKIWTAIS